MSNLGTLSIQQELVKKHTIIGEEVMEKINKNYEQFLTFQNDIFEMDYKSQVAKLREFVNCNYPIEFVLSAILLIGYLNDGISNKEIDWLSLEMQDNYGLEAVFTLEKIDQV